MMKSEELIELLNTLDECNYIEAKKGSAIDKSIMETVCAFSNEPGLGGGYVLLGVEREEQSLFPSYVVTGVEQTDKLQLDFSSQCANSFNQPVRPEIRVESIFDKSIIVAFIPELGVGQKPVYFKNEGLPKGALRRIGSSDQRCTDDDLFVFYNNEDGFDQSIVSGATLEDISEDAIELYRSLRAKINPYAEELDYSNKDLLHSLGCLKKENSTHKITYAGLLLFGSRLAHRRLLPMVRVDYIRVPGNEWVEDPENRFVTIDMRGSLLEMLQRVFSQITDDLPKGFLLADGELQAESIGLPGRVLREAIVNALIHRTYRENQPIQIIRYGNRLEIKNPGFSLKPEEYLGEPGSKNRNPYIAAVFHETNLAETKGSGIRTMRALMQKAHLLPPTFESDHGRNQFTSRLLLHHFLEKKDIEWLSQFSQFDLSELQKLALIFVREVGAIDNQSYRQMNDCDTLKASSELRQMRTWGLLAPKGKGKNTYYVPTFTENSIQYTVSTLPQDLSTPLQDISTPPDEDLSTLLEEDATVIAHSWISRELQSRLDSLGKRINDENLLKEVIVELCSIKALKASEIADLLDKREDYIKRKYLRSMIERKQLEYTHPDMINHPHQAYAKGAES